MDKLELSENELIFLKEVLNKIDTYDYQRIIDKLKSKGVMLNTELFSICRKIDDIINDSISNLKNTRPYVKEVVKKDWSKNKEGYEYILNYNLENPSLESKDINFYLEDKYGETINLDMKIINEKNMAFYNKTPIDMKIYYQAKPSGVLFNTGEWLE